MEDVLRACAGGADRFVVVDTETTGVYPADRVVELAIVTLSLDGEVVEVFDTLINPRRDVSASHIHGITASMVCDAPSFEDIAGDVAIRLHGACLVAHNVPFDTRMLVGEYAKLGDHLVILRGVDTYIESGCRLPDACATFGIDLSGRHRASTDALATARLFLRLAERCDSGSPIAAPFGLNRSGRVLRRDDTAPVQLPEPPLITYLASRLPLHGLAVRSQQYLELVGRAISDLHLDRSERAELQAFAAELQLTDAQIAQAHRRYVNELVDAATADEIVTDDEYDTLVRVASALGVDQAAVEHRIRSYRIDETLTTLREGMQIVFTGNHPTRERDELQAIAAGLGLLSTHGVSKTTDIVCAADPATTSGKAAKARRYGIPVISIDEFLRSKIGDLLAGSGAGQAQLKVITCPDCLSTHSTLATTGGQSRRKCDDCTHLAATEPRRRASIPPTFGGAWAPPMIEWLTCRTCTAAWHRQITKGRKPHHCPTCSGTPRLAAPSLGGAQSEDDAARLRNGGNVPVIAVSHDLAAEVDRDA